MNAHLNDDDRSMPQDPEHAYVWSILPWHVNRSLNAVDAALTDTHLKQCLMCRRELEVLQVLAQHTAAPQTDLECENALQRLSARLERQPTRQIPWAAAAMLTLVTGLMSWISINTETSTAWLRNAGYSMLNEQQIERAGIDGPRVHLVFYDDITERQLRSLVLAVGAAVVKGPTPQGVYTLAFGRETSPNEVIAAIQKLKYSRGVVFAEPALPTKVSEAGDW
jgi:hypothetical protein